MKSVWGNLRALPPVITYDKVSLPVCAFGASLGHVAALALILPVVITLPAPGETIVPTAVAIHVEVMTAPPPAPEGDAIAALTENLNVASEAPAPNPDVVDAAPAPESLDVSDETPDDVTGALPDTVLTETPDAAADLPEAPSAEEAAQEDAAPTETIPSTVAAIDPDGPWSDVPIPARKPQRIFEVDAPEGAQAAPAAKPRAVPPATSSRAVRSRPVVKRRLLGGQPPIGTFDYPVPGRLPGSG